MIAVYLSARMARAAELRAYRDDLEAEGIVVTSRWLDTPPETAHTPAHAAADVADIYQADVFVTFAEDAVELSPLPYAARGGRHVEFGIAYETGIPCIVVLGPAHVEENVFHLLPNVIRVATWDAARVLLEEFAAWRSQPMPVLADLPSRAQPLLSDEVDPYADAYADDTHGEDQ